MPTLLESIRAAAAPSGLNLVGAIPSSRYDAAVQSALRASRLDPRARSIVVIGNGGGDFWRAFTAYCDTNSGWSERDHPLDDFTREIVAHDLAGPLAERGVTSTIVYPFDRASLNFVELAKLAGLGGPSILGILVHPVFGPWIAFRAALLLDAELDHPGAALGFDPCPTCTARTCIPACPVGAVSFQSGWDIPRCLIHRVEVEPDCAPRCHARAACVLGPEHRYPDDELAYHQRRALESMREYYTKQIKPERADPG